ncbi:UNVERIFIED_ORG: serine/threonine protein kinase [Xanthomonas axonopodis]
MSHDPAANLPLKSDTFGRILLVREGERMFVRRDVSVAPWLLRGVAWWLARREALALRQLDGVPRTPRLLDWDGRHLDRSYLDGAAMYQRPPRGDLAYFRSARRLLQQLHRRGVAHNDLAKEANWLVQEDGSPAVIDFQLAVRGNPRARWMRLLAREDLRHPAQTQAHVLPGRTDPGGTPPAQAHLLGPRAMVRYRQTGLPLRDPPRAALGRQRRAGAEALSGGDWGIRDWGFARAYCLSGGLVGGSNEGISSYESPIPTP